MKVVIVGGVAGGAGAAARLRRNDEKAEIVLIERGGFISFANCGLPYYLGGAIQEESDLLLQTPEGFSQRFNVDVRVKHEVLSVNPAQRYVKVKNLTSGEEYPESYDKLILSPGARPASLSVPGADFDFVFTLRNMEDTFKIRDFLAGRRPKSAAVIGGGYIGLEMADNLKDAGLEVSIIEAMDHVVATLDFDMASEVHNHIREMGVGLYLNARAEKIEKDGVVLAGGEKIPAEIVIMSVGVAPDTQFLRDSGLALGKKGEILVDEELKTNLPDIYALGDAVTVKHIVTGETRHIPLASPANKQARIVADVVAGKKARYTGAQGTAIAKVFGMTVAVSGAGEAHLTAAGILFQKSITYSNSNASYYPGGEMMALKLLFDPATGRVLGAQATGKKGVDKRMDVLAAAIRNGLTVFDLQELELSYAPPYSSAKDPVNMAGYVAGNIVEGMCRPVYSEELKSLPENALLLDVRTKSEYDEGTIGNALHFELDFLRENLGKIPKERELIVLCRVGLRAHIAQQILEQNGFKTRNLIGGYRLYEAMTKDRPEFCV